jgi:cobalamin biosynthesis protein CobT
MDANAFSLLGNGMILRNIVPSLGEPLTLDLRYAKLAEIARQRANISRPLGTPRNSGNNVRSLERIIRDGKIFADRSPSTSFRPMDVMIVVDCSGSMRGTKFSSAIQQALGCAIALITARCQVQVWGHTSDGAYKNDVGIIKLLDRNETTQVLAKRLGEMKENPWRYLAANRDGYALEYLATKLPKGNRKRMILVISDGMPSASNPNYDGSMAIQHTQIVVKKIRESGIMVKSLSIDISAFYPNNIIYGESNNVNSTATDALDTLVKQILIG